MTSLSLGGLVIGVAVLVLVLSVLNGFERELRERVLSVVPHAVLTSPTGLTDWQVTAALVDQHPEVTGVAPLEEIAGLAVNQGKVTGIQVNGVIPELESRVSKVPEFMREGAFTLLDEANYGALMGSELASQLGLQVGDRFTVILPDVQMSLAGPQPRTRRFVVKGIFEVGSDADKSQVFVHLDDALKLSRKRQVDSLRIQVKNLFDASRVLQEVAAGLPQSDWLGASWLRRHGNLYSAIQTQK
ncbi:MAG: ABC transporter permease, partial [Pseudomonadales bacterium]